jgi:iron complex transport system substrate-binding protein
MASIRTGVALAALLGALAAGCGGSPAEPPEKRDARGAFPVTVEDASGEVTVARRPERIVSLSPSATETLFAIGAGEQVVAVDRDSDHPPGTPRTDLAPYEPNVEAIAGHRPDLVVLPADAPRDAIDGLRRLRVPVLAEPAPDDLDGAYAEMRQLGAATGHREAAERLATEVRERIERLIAAAPDAAGLKVFHELGPDLYSAGSKTFIGRIYARLGLRNIADPAARRSGAAYPQLSPEAVVAADPDLIVLADAECCGQTPAKVARRAGWRAVSAVREHAVVAVGDDVATRWGPRIPVLVERVVRALEAAVR